MGFDMQGRLGERGDRPRTVRVDLGGGNFADLEPDRYEVDRSLLEDANEENARAVEQIRDALNEEEAAAQAADPLQRRADEIYDRQRAAEVAVETAATMIVELAKAILSTVHDIRDGRVVSVGTPTLEGWHRMALEAGRRLDLAGR